MARTTALFRSLVLATVLVIAGCQSGSDEEEQGEVLLSVSITWNNSQSGMQTGTMELKVLDSAGSPVSDATKDVSAGVISSTPVTNTDQISVQYRKSAGSTFALTMLGCAVSNGTGSVTAASLPTVAISCP